MSIAGGKATIVLTKSKQTYLCVEIYLPKRLDYLSRLYNYLKEQLEAPSTQEHGLPIKGFSIYEVDGAWKGTDNICDERTLIIRILFEQPQKDAGHLLDVRIADLGQHIAEIADNEKQIMVCSYTQAMTMFEP